MITMGCAESGFSFVGSENLYFGWLLKQVGIL